MRSRPAGPRELAQGSLGISDLLGSRVSNVESFLNYGMKEDLPVPLTLLFVKVVNFRLASCPKSLHAVLAHHRRGVAGRHVHCKKKMCAFKLQSVHVGI